MRLQELKDRVPPEELKKYIDTVGILENETKLYDKDGGRYQLKKSFIEQFNRDNNTNLTKKDVEDPITSTAVLMHHLNTKYKGKDINTIEAYMKHHFGETGGRRILNSDRSEGLRNIIGSSVYEKNDYIQDNGLLTTGDLLDFWENRIEEKTKESKNIARKQYMLRELGYLNGEIDAIEGNKTKKAYDNFIKETGLSEEEINAIQDNFYELPYQNKIGLSKNGYLRETSDVNIATTDRFIDDVYNLYETMDYDFNKTNQSLERLKDYYYTGALRGRDTYNYDELNRGVDVDTGRYDEERQRFYGPVKPE